MVTACSTGAHAIGDAARMIALDDADVMIAGGAESAICRLGIAGFIACKALATKFNDEPKRGSRPYDKDRDGFVMGEGAGIAGSRGTRTRQGPRRQNLRRSDRLWPVGRCLSHHRAGRPTATAPTAACRWPCKRAGLPAHEIDYINAHGTSTPLGDEIELHAVERVMGNRTEGLSMSSTKSSTGHLLGAAGAVEAIFSMLAIRDNVCPPTLNLDNPSVETKIDLVPHAARQEGDQHSSVQFLWFWWHQRITGHAPLRGLTQSRTAIEPAKATGKSTRTAGE